ncbi:ERF family protein [Paenibacillus sp. FSL R7-0128]|uniref:ERF family protein n=1 Tax=Paenibacillus sp. FSL R7-0128 TaxID=2954529 RepID=UPI0030FCC039
MSEEIKPLNLYQKLVEVRKVVTYLQKATEGSQYKYTPSSQVLAAVRSKMDEMGLILEPEITGHQVSGSDIEFKGSNGEITKRTTTYFTELDMTMTWVNADNPDEKVTKLWYAQGVDIAGEKGVGKALTYAEKYFMLKFFNIATDKDDPDAFQQRMDGDAPPPSKPSTKTPAAPKEPSQTNSPAAQHNGSSAGTGPQGLISTAQISYCHKLKKDKGIDEDDFRRMISEIGGRESIKELTKKEASEFINLLNNYQKGA